MHPYRTHTCGELRKEHVDQTVRLSGWLHRKRDFGGLLFVDLRDHYGITQVIVQPNAPFFETLSRTKPESVLTVTGRVVAREGSNVNPGIATGEIELVAAEVNVESVAETLPMQVCVEEDCPEETRLEHRFLDLRREKIHQNIVMRHRLCQHIRQYLTARDFVEFHTPILTSSSPEGARDFLVPSRLQAQAVTFPSPISSWPTSKGPQSNDSPLGSSGERSLGMRLRGRTMVLPPIVITWRG